MTQISKTLIETGAAVKFPYELKDAFRNAFPSAKWNPSQKRWEVGSRSIKRLDQWISELNKTNVIAEIEARDESDLVEKEIEFLQREIENVRREINSSRANIEAIKSRKDKANELKEILETQKEELRQVAVEQCKAIEEEQKAADDVQSLIFHIVSKDKVNEIRSNMRRNWIPKAGYKQKFEEYQAQARSIIEELEKFGIECKALTLAARANFNRPDRDKSDLNLDIEFVSSN